MAVGPTVGRANVRVLPDTRGTYQMLMREIRRIEKLAKIDVKLDLDTEYFAQKVHGAVQAAEDTAPDITVAMGVDSDGLVSETRRAAAAASKVARIQVKADLDSSRLVAEAKALGSVGSLSGTLVRFGGIASAATVAVAGLAPSIVAVSGAAWSALAPMAALTAAMAPAALGSAAMAVGVLKTAFSGMGDALKAADPAAFAAAIADMPPAAQAGATALRELKTSFTDLGDGISSAFWSNLSNLGNLQSLVAPLGDAMRALAADMGTATAGLVDFVSQGTGLTAVRTLIDNAGAAAGSLSQAFAGVLQGLISVGAAAAPIFADLSAKIAELAQGWADSMTKGFADGSLQAYFADAVAKAQQFWGVMQQLGGIVGGVFSAMSAAGQPFLGTIGQVIESTNQWVNSVAGMSALTDFFTSMGAAVATIMPLLGQLAGIIGSTVAPAISGFIQAIGPGLSAAIDGLGAGLAAIAPAVAPLGAAFGAVLQAISPLLPALGQVIAVLGTALASALTAAAPMISSFATSLSNISPTLLAVGTAVAGAVAMFGSLVGPIMSVLNVVRMIGPVFGLLSGPLGLVVGIIGLVIAAFTQVPGVMEPLKGAFMSIVESLTPLITMLQTVAQQLMAALMPVIVAMVPVIIQIAGTLAQVIAVLTPIISTIVQLAVTIVSALMPVITALLPVIGNLVSVFGSIVTAVAPVISIIVSVIAAFASLLAGIIGFVASALASILSFVTGVIAGFASMIGGVIGMVAGWISTLIGFFSSLVMTAVSFMSNMWGSIVGAFSSGVSTAVAVVSQMPGRAREALGNVGSILVESGRALIQGFIDGIKAMIGAVANAAKSAVQAARDFFPFSPAKRGPFSGRGWVLYSGLSIGDAFAEGISRSAGGAAAASQALMDSAASNLSGYRADVSGVAGGAPGPGGGDYSINIGTIVAADETRPLRAAEELQLKAEIRGGRR